MSLLWRPNNFFFSARFKETHRLMYKKWKLFVYKFVVIFHVFEITPSRCTLESWTILFETPFFRYLPMRLSNLCLKWCLGIIFIKTFTKCFLLALVMRFTELHNLWNFAELPTLFAPLITHINSLSLMTMSVPVKWYCPTFW